MMPVLIVGGSFEDRQTKLTELVTDLKVIEQLDGQEESIKIEQIRKLTSRLSYQYTAADKVALVIDEAQSAGIPAQNALLKSLEELPDAVSFFLTCVSQNRILPTIISRCQVIKLGPTWPIVEPADEQELVNVLKLVGKGQVGELLLISQDWLKTNTAKEKLEKLFIYLRQHTRSNPQPKRATALQAVVTCLKDLEGNINQQLALDHLFLELVELSESN